MIDFYVSHAANVPGASWPRLHGRNAARAMLARGGVVPQTLRMFVGGATARQAHAVREAFEEITGSREWFISYAPSTRKHAMSFTIEGA